MKRSIAHPKSIFDQVINVPINLRTKLVLANMLITFFAITGMGYYVYLRAQQANAFLTSQFELSVREKTEEGLTNTINTQIAELNSFFQTKSRDITIIGANIENLISQESLLNLGTYWNAQSVLARLPNGSWDNPDNEPSSIFIPAKIELTENLASELNTLKHVEFTSPLFLEANPEIIAIYFGGVSGETVYFPNIDLANIVPPDFDVTSRPWYVEAAPAQNKDKTVVWSEPYQDAALHGLVVTASVPVFDAGGKFRGVTAMDIQLNIITEIVSNIRIGETGYAFLVDQDGRLIALPQSGYGDFGVTPDTVPLGEIMDNQNLTTASQEIIDLLPKVSNGESGMATLAIDGVERLVVYKPIAEVDYGLAILVPVEELQRETIAANEQVSMETRNTIVISVILVAGILIAASLIALSMGNILTAPLKSLISVTEKISAGNLDARANIQSRDEIGTLATTFNKMADDLNKTLSTLENRVTERTLDFEIARKQSEKRANDLVAMGDISRLISSEQKLETMLPLITRLVSERYNFYHVGIFLIDETGQYAVLQAANSEGGRKMLERGHRLEVGESGIVGYVAKYGTPRIALDVGLDAVFFNNPDLANTRSEMGLPLNARGRTLGVLDVQSDKSGAFTENDANSLNILADQLAINIENARLFEQTQRTLNEYQALYRQNIQEGWTTFIREESLIGYQHGISGGKKLTTPIDTAEIRDAINRGNMLVMQPEGEKADSFIIVPVKLRGQIIGTLKIQAPTKNRVWSTDEINLAGAVSDRLSLALENARLIEESRNRAAKEQMITEVTSKIGASIDLQNVLQTAVEELGRAMPGSEILLQLKADQDNNKTQNPPESRN